MARMMGRMVVAGIFCAVAAAVGVGMMQRGAGARGVVVQDVGASEAGWTGTLGEAIADARARGKAVGVFFLARGAEGPALPTGLMGMAGEIDFVKMAAPTGYSEGAAATAVWAERMQVKEMPTLVVLDERGRAVAKRGLRDVREADVGMVRGMLAVKAGRDAAFAVAAGAVGEERARALDAGLELVKEFRGMYLEEMEVVVALDGKNGMGLRAKYLPEVAGQRLDGVIQAEVYPLIDGQNFKGAVERLDGLIAEWGPASGKLDMLLAFKGQVLYSMGEPGRALAALDEAMRYAPAGGESLGRIQVARAQMLEKGGAAAN